jgi:hypothetical protein
MEVFVMPAGTPVQIRLADHDRDALDRYRRGHANPPSRAAAARELMREALLLRLPDQADPSHGEAAAT